jgi:phenylpyruvate tautomerase PptA (4-oxalocrotonate tautomerase family)
MTETDRQDIVKIITEIVSTVTNMHLYPPTHPQVAPLVDRLYESISMLLEAVPELTLILVDEDIVLHGKPLPNVGPVGKSFVKLLT